MSLLVFFVPANRAARRLRYLPFWFNELRYLPLPFLDTFIVQAYQESPAAAQRAINYLINSTNQQTLAARAMVKIAAGELTQCKTTRDMATVADHLAWIPSPPPKELGTALPQFVEVSQSVRAAQEATSLYRQHELLNAPIRQLQTLSESLAISRSATVATTFRPIAQTWLSTLQAAQRTLKERSRQSGEIPQVYIAGPPIDADSASDRFKGRQDLFREIESLTLSPQPPVLLLHGGRRTGKSSLLNYLPRCIGSEIIPLHIDLQGAASATTLRGLAESISRLMIEAAQRSRNARFPYPDEDAIRRDPFPALQQWFLDIERTIRGKRFLLCLDEFERLEEVVAETGSRAPLNFFRYVLQNRRQWILLFSGSHTLDELAPYWSDYLINTRPIRVSYLQEADARELIQHPIEGFPDLYTPSAVDEIIRLTHCQPYLVQLTCSAVVDHLNRHKRQQASLQDIHAVTPAVLEQASANLFRDRYRTITDAERHCLQQLLEEQSAAAMDKRVMRRLVQQREILHQVDEGYDFQIPLFKMYVESQL